MLKHYKPKSTANTSNKLAFYMETQQMDSWCWLAIATSIARYYDRDSGWSQCKCLDATHPDFNGICCEAYDQETKMTCDITGFLVDHKVEVGSFITLGLAEKGDPSAYSEGLFPFQTIVKCIDLGQPLAVNLITNEKHQYPNGQWGTFAHFIAIIGYEIINGTEFVVTADPMYLGDSRVNENLMTYENLISEYDLLTYPSSVAYSFHTLNHVTKS